MKFTQADIERAAIAAMRFVEGTENAKIERYEDLAKTMLEAVDLGQQEEELEEMREGKPSRRGFYWVKIKEEEAQTLGSRWFVGKWENNSWVLPSGFAILGNDVVKAWHGPLERPKK